LFLRAVRGIALLRGGASLGAKLSALGRPVACVRREGAPPTRAVRWGALLFGKASLGAMLLAFGAGRWPAFAARARLPQGRCGGGFAFVEGPAARCFWLLGRP